MVIAELIRAITEFIDRVSKLEDDKVMRALYLLGSILSPPALVFFYLKNFQKKLLTNLILY